jgi:hypothetical protein
MPKMERFNYKEWLDTYHNKEIVDLKKHFTEEELNIIRKLGIEIKDKVYTEYEFEILDMDILAYYKYDDMTKEELEITKNLEETGVSKEEYEKLLKKMEEINSLYHF